MLSELDEVYGQKKLDDKQYSVLKDQITKFRQAHVLKANKKLKNAGKIIRGSYPKTCADGNKKLYINNIIQGKFTK